MRTSGQKGTDFIQNSTNAFVHIYNLIDFEIRTWVPNDNWTHRNWNQTRGMRCEEILASIWHAAMVHSIGLAICTTKDCVHGILNSFTWWRHQMETFSASLALCAGNSPVTGEIPTQRPVAQSFDVFFYLRLNKRLSKQSWGWWFETPSHPLWRHCNDSRKDQGSPSSINKLFLGWGILRLYDMIRSS